MKKMFLTVWLLAAALSGAVFLFKDRFEEVFNLSFAIILFFAFASSLVLFLGARGMKSDNSQTRTKAVLGGMSLNFLLGLFFLLGIMLSDKELMKSTAVPYVASFMTNLALTTYWLVAMVKTATPIKGFQNQNSQET